MAHADSPDADASLVERAVKGERAAVASLLKACGPIVRARIAPKISGVWQSVLDADDVMQVTYLEAFLRIGRFDFRGPGSFIAWLTMVAENNLRDAIKELERMKRPSPKRQVKPSTGAEDSYLALVELLGVTTTTPSIAAARGEIKSALDEALDKMPPDYAKVVRMYDLDGMSAQQVAEKIGKTPGAVYMLLARAHDRLKDTLGSESKYFSRTS